MDNNKMRNEMNGKYICSECGRELPLSPEYMVCPDCSAKQKDDEPLRGVLEVELSGTIPKDWDNIDLLPVERKWFPPIPVGNTPLWEPSRLREDTGFPNLFLKDDTANPTGSLKDRASWLVAAFAKANGIDRIVVASTGNAGSSMAGVGAAAGINIRLYLPASAPPAKMVQASMYGAHLVKVNGTYDQAFDESLRYSTQEGGLSRNTAYNPLTVEGKKTAALEIFRQLGRVPDHVFVPVGDGVILSGIFKGFEDLVTFGLADRMPEIIAVQSEGSSAIARALTDGGFSSPVSATTLADSISVDVPRGGYLALSKLKKHNGRAVIVSDREILDAQYLLSRGSGLFAEPASAAAWAGFLKIKKDIGADKTVVILLTGTGLKDIDNARKGLDEYLNQHPGEDPDNKAEEQ